MNLPDKILFNNNYNNNMSADNEKLDIKSNLLNSITDDKSDKLENIGRWTEEENIKFVEGVLMYGNDWKKIPQYIGSRTTTQIKSHAQKFLIKSKKIVDMSYRNSRYPTNDDELFLVLIKKYLRKIKSDLLIQKNRSNFLKVYLNFTKRPFENAPSSDDIPCTCACGSIEEIKENETNEADTDLKNEASLEKEKNKNICLKHNGIKKGSFGKLFIIRKIKRKVKEEEILKQQEKEREKQKQIEREREKEKREQEIFKDKPKSIQGDVMTTLDSDSTPRHILMNFENQFATDLRMPSFSLIEKNCNIDLSSAIYTDAYFDPNMNVNELSAFMNIENDMPLKKNPFCLDFNMFANIVPPLKLPCMELEEDDYFSRGNIYPWYGA